jgi:hypothetical protein
VPAADDPQTPPSPPDLGGWTPATATAAIAAWVQQIVLDLGLCPFAAQPWAAGRVEIRCVVGDDDAARIAGVWAAIVELVAQPPDAVETSLIGLPGAFADFEEFLAAIDVLEQLLEEQGLSTTVQLASFHPEYQFADAPADDLANYTNRAPLAIVHALRTASVSAAIAAHGDTLAIPAANVARLRAMDEPTLRARAGLPPLRPRE